MERLHLPMGVGAVEVAMEEVCFTQRVNFLSLLSLNPSFHFIISEFVTNYLFCSTFHFIYSYCS